MTPKPRLPVTWLRRHATACRTYPSKHCRQHASHLTSTSRASALYGTSHDFCTSSAARSPEPAVKEHPTLHVSEPPSEWELKPSPHRNPNSEDGERIGKGRKSSIRNTNKRLGSESIRSTLEAWAEDPANLPFGKTLRDVSVDDAEQVDEFLDESAEFQQPLDDMASTFLDGFDRLEAFSEEESDDYLRPRGSLVHRGRTVSFDTMAIILGRLGNHVLYYTPGGNLEITSVFTDYHMVRNFATHEEIDPVFSYLSKILPSRIDDPENYKTVIPRKIGVHLLDKMKTFQEEIDSEFRKYSSAFEAAHKIVSHPTDLKVMLLEDIATTITGKAEHELSEALLFAVMRFIMSDFGFQPVPQKSALYRAVFVESQESVAAVRRVQNWVRLYQEAAAYATGAGKAPEHVLEGSKPLSSFAHKCRVMANRSRHLRRYSDDGQPLTANPGLAQHGGDRDGYVEGVTFSSSDRDFIHCLMLGIQLIGFRSSTLRTLLLVIVKSTRLYNVPVIQGVTIQTLLQEIGVLQTWQASDAVDRLVSLPNQKLFNDIKDIEERISQGQSVKDAAGLQDSMAHLRKDWGRLPVYCIDWQRTTVLDDGLSLEHVAGTPDQYWLHWHIAHPSAFFTADHPLGQLSAHNMSGNYFVEAILQMLPQWLHSDLGIDVGKPVITISMKLNTAGDILDKTIQPGIIHNIHRLDFEQVNRELGRETNLDRIKAMTDRGMWILLLGKIDADREHVDSTNFDRSQTVIPERNTHETPTFATEIKTVLERLDQLAQGLAQKYPKSPFRIQTFTPFDSVKNPYSGVASPESHRLPERARFATKDPGLRISFGGGLSLPNIETSSEPALSFTYVIGELALAVSRSVAEWADERSIPLFYDGSVAVMDKMASTKALQTFRESVAALNHSSDPRRLQEVKSLVLGALSVRTISSSPRKDVATGVTHSATISSPLRKHRDLVNLWQIDAALREEAKLGRSLVDNTDHSYLPKSKVQMDRSIRLYQFRKRTSELFHRHHRLHWRCLAVARAFYLKKGKLPTFLTASIRPTTFATLSCLVHELEMFAEIPEGPGEDSNPVQADETWQVQLTGVNTFQHRLQVRMIKKLDNLKDHDPSSATIVSSQSSGVASPPGSYETSLTSTAVGG